MEYFITIYEVFFQTGGFTSSIYIGLEVEKKIEIEEEGKGFFKVRLKDIS